MNFSDISQTKVIKWSLWIFIGRSNNFSINRSVQI